MIFIDHLAGQLFILKSSASQSVSSTPSKMKIVLRLRNYLSHTSVHGFRIIVQKDRHSAEKVLWTVLNVLSWIGAGFLIHTSWQAFQYHAVSNVVETNYLHATISFPAITVCEDNNLPSVLDQAERMFGKDHDTNLDELLRELTYFKGSAHYLNEFCSGNSTELPCPTGNFSQIAKMARSSCEGIFKNCFWNGVPFNCCKHFVPTETELGPCFTLGSKQFGRQLLRTISYRQSALPSLRIELKCEAVMYPHSEANLPFLNTLTSDTYTPEISTIKRYSLTITDVENPSNLRDLTVAQRQCRFPDENYLESADYYSYSACIVECRREAQLRLCNCTSHFMPKSNSEQHCDLGGILCLNQNYAQLSVQKTKWSKIEGLLCYCLPGCYDPEYNLLWNEREFIYPETNSSVVEIHLERFPTLMYKRKVVQSRLTLLVSVGSAAALFAGASILSVAEFFYFFLFRSHTDKELKTQADGSTDANRIQESSAYPEVASNKHRDIRPTPPLEILPGPSRVCYPDDVNEETPTNLTHSDSKAKCHWAKVRAGLRNSRMGPVPS